VPATDPGFVVREARDTDHEAIRELTVRVYVSEGYAGPQYVPSLADVEGRAAHTELLVADAGGQVVGAVALAAGGGPYAELAGPGEAVFRMLVVDPHWRGRGVAHLLVQSCLDRAREAGCHRMVISTEAQMFAAHRLYQRMGFTRAAELDWSPVDGVDLLAYVRDL